MARSGGWAAGGVPRDYAGTILTSTTGGSWVRLGGISGRRIAIMVREMPGAGQIRAYWNGKFVKTFDQDETPAEYRDVYTVLNFATVHTGTLEIRVIGGTGPVRIDGVAVKR